MYLYLHTYEVLQEHVRKDDVRIAVGKFDNELQGHELPEEVLRHQLVLIEMKEDIRKFFLISLSFTN